MSTDLEKANFVFVGKMEMTKDEMFILCEKYNGNSQKNITRATNYLVIGKNPSEIKMAKAKENGIKIITEQEFFEMIGEWKWF